MLATGFDMWDANFPAIEILGRDGKDLGKWWRATRFQAYQGIAVPGFPNLLSLASPYSYSGLSYFTTIEAQMKHMDRLFTEVRRRGAATFEVKDPANEEFLGWVTERLDDSVFHLGSCATAPQLLLQPARRGRAAAAELDAEQPQGRGDVPARGLRLQLDASPRRRRSGSTLAARPFSISI